MPTKKARSKRLPCDCKPYPQRRKAFSCHFRCHPTIPGGPPARNTPMNRDTIERWQPAKLRRDRGRVQHVDHPRENGRLGAKQGTAQHFLDRVGVVHGQDDDRFQAGEIDSGFRGRAHAVIVAEVARGCIFRSCLSLKFSVQ